jgi:hypothetical protein
LVFLSKKVVKFEVLIKKTLEWAPIANPLGFRTAAFEMLKIIMDM